MKNEKILSDCCNVEFTYIDIGSKYIQYWKCKKCGKGEKKIEHFIFN